MKIPIITMIIFAIPICSYGINMCAHTGTYIITLSRSRDGISMTSDSAAGTWAVTFDYSLTSQNSTTMTGLAACNEITGTVNTADSAVQPLLTDVGQNCWCMMKYPLVSDWIFINEYSTAADCASSCVGACGNNAKTSTAFRNVMYENIW